jgi:hypothetical protein
VSVHASLMHRYTCELVVILLCTIYVGLGPVLKIAEH